MLEGYAVQVVGTMIWVNQSETAASTLTVDVAKTRNLRQ
jgi:hypothetical protein